MHAQYQAWGLLSSGAPGLSPLVSQTWVLWFKPFLRKAAVKGGILGEKCDYVAVVEF